MRARVSFCTRSHRGLGGEAVADRLVQAPHPAAIVGEHAVGFEHLAMLAGAADVAARQHVVDRQPAGSPIAGVEPPQLVLDVLGDQRR